MGDSHGHFPSVTTGYFEVSIPAHAGMFTNARCRAGFRYFAVNASEVPGYRCKRLNLDLGQHH